MSSPLQSAGSRGEFVDSTAMTENMQDMVYTLQNNDFCGESDENTVVAAQYKQDITSPPQINDSHGESHHNTAAATGDKHELETGIGTTTFPRFSKLCTEVRLRIWKFAALQHSLDLDLNQLSTLEVVPVPPLLHTCRESREEGVKLYVLSPVIDHDARQLRQNQLLAMANKTYSPSHYKICVIVPEDVVYIQSKYPIKLSPINSTIPLVFEFDSLEYLPNDEALEFCHLMIGRWISKVFGSHDLRDLLVVCVYWVKDTEWTIPTLPHIRVVRDTQLSYQRLELKLNKNTYKHWFNYQDNVDEQTATEQQAEAFGE